MFYFLLFRLLLDACELTDRLVFVFLSLLGAEIDTRSSLSLTDIAGSSFSDLFYFDICSSSPSSSLSSTSLSILSSMKFSSSSQTWHSSTYSATYGALSTFSPSSPRYSLSCSDSFSSWRSTSLPSAPIAVYCFFFFFEFNASRSVDKNVYFTWSNVRFLDNFYIFWSLSYLNIFDLWLFPFPLKRFWAATWPVAARLRANLLFMSSF